MKNLLLLLLLLLWFTPAFAAIPESFNVEHDHLLRSCRGELFFNENNVVFKSENKKHERTWDYGEIQQIEIHPGRISVLTYEDRKIEFGADRVFTFKLVDGTVTEDLVQALEGKLQRPVISSILPSGAEPVFQIPVRHRKFLDDDEGVLEIGEAYLAYRTAAKNGSRVWRYDELLSIGSTGSFQLRLGALEKTGGEYGEERNYVFDLKRRLSAEEYDFLWEKINRPRIDSGGW